MLEITVIALPVAQIDEATINERIPSQQSHKTAKLKPQQINKQNIYLKARSFDLLTRVCCSTKSQEKYLSWCACNRVKTCSTPDKGYPWYPARIINPELTTGEPLLLGDEEIPQPSVDIIKAGNKLNLEGESQHHLVLFFDQKRTWWLLKLICARKLRISFW